MRLQAGCCGKHSGRTSSRSTDAKTLSPTAAACLVHGRELDVVRLYEVHVAGLQASKALPYAGLQMQEQQSVPSVHPDDPLHIRIAVHRLTPKLGSAIRVRTACGSAGDLVADRGWYHTPTEKWTGLRAAVFAAPIIPSKCGSTDLQGCPYLDTGGAEVEDVLPVPPHFRGHDDLVPRQVLQAAPQHLARAADGLAAAHLRGGRSVLMVVHALTGPELHQHGTSDGVSRL